MAAVPFFNASCPGGIDVHADEGGPVYVQGREAALKRFNDRYVEARDANSGITLSISRSDDGTPQISYTGRGGANGICQVTPRNMAPAASGDRRLLPPPVAMPREVTCESTDQQQVSCDLDTRGNVEIVRQLSHTRCEQGQELGPVAALGVGQWRVPGGVPQCVQGGHSARGGRYRAAVPATCARARRAHAGDPDAGGQRLPGTDHRLSRWPLPVHDAQQRPVQSLTPVRRRGG
jgi:hypothetical protein